MKNLGILTACHHYPTIQPGIRHLDKQFRLWLGALGHVISDTSVYDCHDGVMPFAATDAEIWIVSGALLAPCPLGRDIEGRLHQFLRAAAAIGRPVYGIYHGEHIVHDALAAVGTPPPETPATPRSLRNPFRSFQCRDRLFMFDPETRRMTAAQRPRALTLPAMFGATMRAA